MVCQGTLVRTELAKEQTYENVDAIDPCPLVRYRRTAGWGIGTNPKRRCCAAWRGRHGVLKRGHPENHAA